MKRFRETPSSSAGYVPPEPDWDFWGMPWKKKSNAEDPSIAAGSNLKQDVCYFDFGFNIVGAITLAT